MWSQLGAAFPSAAAVRAAYGDRRLLAVLLMGFSSGLPLPLTFGTLSFWMAEVGVSRTSIGLFALVGTAYNLKFLWAPIIDRVPLPMLTAALGRRRSWALVIQLLLAVAILALGLSDPRENLVGMALAAVAVAFLSASQDIVIDAFRIEMLSPEQQGAGAAATQWGYRFGMIASSSGALFLAAGFDWPVAFATMAVLMGVGMATVWLTAEPAVPAAPAPRRGVRGFFQDAVIGPFADFTRRPLWLVILLFVVFYKFGDALANTMANILYVELGFTRVEVATVSKFFGIWSTLAGVAVGGVVVGWLGYYRSLLLCGVLQMLSNLSFVWLYYAGNDVGVLTVAVALENFCGGLGSAAFVAYLSSLCSVAFTATQYALLSSLAAVGRTTLSAGSGGLVDALGWVPFFGISLAAALPGLILLVWLMRRLEPPPKQAAVLADAE
ncbi:MAG: MFS transporter [Alphaproteobacteria bacterium]|nr:MFS transporter [Alphaproteobacteria bacterium]